MSAEEIAAKGLTKYAPNAKSSDAAAAQMTRTFLPKRDARPGTGDVAASGCWYHQFQYGASGLWGYGSEDWCGDGTWITYRSSGCWGSSSWPTYHYGGCSKNDSYGVGWNVSDLRVDWDLCYAWWPVGGFCSAWDHPWEKYRYSGGGGVYWLGGS